jgi:hypothetical protein
MNKLLEESEGLIFRSAVTISETDILIGRSRPLIRHRRDEKPQAAINEVSPVSDYRSLPTCAALQSRRDRMDSLLPSLSGDPPCILIIDDDTALLTALADTLKIRLERIVIDTSNSGTDGLARVKRNHYNIILGNVSMPAIDGLLPAASAQEDCPELVDHYDDRAWGRIDPKNRSLPWRPGIDP